MGTETTGHTENRQTCQHSARVMPSLFRRSFSRDRAVTLWKGAYLFPRQTLFSLTSNESSCLSLLRAGVTGVCVPAGSAVEDDYLIVVSPNI